MFDEKILLDWAKSYQNEIKKEMDMIHMARKVKALQAQHTKSDAPMLERLLRFCGFGVRPVKKPVSPHVPA